MAGLRLGVADAKATLVAELKTKQFRAIPLTGKVVAGPCMMTMPPCVLYRDVGPRSRTVERQQNCNLGLWQFQKFGGFISDFWHIRLRCVLYDS